MNAKGDPGSSTGKDAARGGNACVPKPTHWRHWRRVDNRHWAICQQRALTPLTGINGWELRRLSYVSWGDEDALLVPGCADRIGQRITRDPRVVTCVDEWIERSWRYTLDHTLGGAGCRGRRLVAVLDPPSLSIRGCGICDAANRRGSQCVRVCVKRDVGAGVVATTG